MDNDIRDKIESNFIIIPEKTKKAFIFLSKQSWIGESGWYLAGGTALALQTGNRKSVDLDFFTTERNFNSKLLRDKFIDNNEWKISFEEINTIYAELFGAKVSFIAYPFFIPKQEFIKYGSIKIIDKLDVAIMKIIAISQRGKKRDFFDLYWCVKNIESLENLVKRLKIQYPSVAHDYHHILKSIMYFEDAEDDPEPDINFNASCKMVKAFFKKEIPILLKKLILEN